ncbi:NnrS family protein [Candidatus Accumulibacter phosphatis]|uniref:NnrS family protein n=1 Tax=Candidatus Accumulibacter phosphatis TaxID=327160 RepID=A0ABX1TQT8_9PROT|nr:NnrS family protein [Candidatus Accumulibacter phosphatis]NMQ26597.1 NnrS family protein [Candidatus Accumulibacter phosphatis]
MSKPSTIDERQAPSGVPAAKFALWALGFRPFYLLASIFAALSIPLWIAQYAGYLPAALAHSPAWHGHEMLFGYTLAVIVGFLFTASRNWTGQPTPSGAALLAFALLWVAGRVLMLTPYAMAAAIANAALPVAAAIALAIPLWKSRNQRNYFFVPLLMLLGAAVLAMHLSWLGLLAWPERASLLVGLDMVLFIIAVMGGRVIPMFTNNGIPGTLATRHPLIEKLALGSVLLLLVADVLPAPAALITIIALTAALAHAARLYLWQPWRTLRTPLVWVLHAAYAWIVVYLVLRASAALGLVAEALALHALTIGAIGGMTLGMMTRTARGHTGRPLVADRYEIAAFVLVLCAALIRVFGGMIFPDAYLGTLIGSGICWSLAFTLYAIRYWPVLSRARLDGKPG